MKQVFFAFFLFAFGANTLAQEALQDEKHKNYFDEPAAINPKLDIESVYWRGGENCINIVEYLDFQCPYCRENHRHIQSIIGESKGGVCVYIKHLPLNENHKYAYLLAAHYEAIKLQNAAAAHRFHDLAFEILEAPSGFLYALLDQEGQLRVEDEFFEGLYEIINALGVDVERVKMDWLAVDIQQKIEADILEAAELGAKETPFFWIEGYIYRGVQDFETLTEIVQSVKQEVNRNE